MKNEKNKCVGHAVSLIDELMEFNSNIDVTTWCSAFAYILIDEYTNAGASIDNCKEQFELACEHYRDLLNKQK